MNLQLLVSYCCVANAKIIVLEYLVPSTGKLYHHKMKLRQLKWDSETGEMLEYLRKRHALYFMTGKFNDKQITDLLDKMKYKLKQIHIAKNGSIAANDKKPASLITPLGSSNTNTKKDDFKDFNQLPSLSNKPA